MASGPLAVRLEKGGVITGVVREGDGNRPIAAARVGVESGVSTPEGWSAEAMRNEAVTDAEGRFRLEGIGRAPVRLSARARGFGRAERAGVRAGASVELFLFPGATLAGAVRDNGGRPMKGATVRAVGDTSWNAPPTERTDERGEFELAGFPAGEYTVVAREGGRAPGIASVVVEPGGEAAVSLTVSDGGYVTGRIVDAAGRPLAGRVRLEVFEDRGLPALRATASPPRRGPTAPSPSVRCPSARSASASPRRVTRRGAWRRSFPPGAAPSTSATWRSTPGSRSGAGCGTGREAPSAAPPCAPWGRSRERPAKPRPRAGPTVVLTSAASGPGATR